MKNYSSLLKLTVLISLFILAAPGYTEPLGFPSPYEQLMLELLNRDRADPDAAAVRYGKALNDSVPPDQTLTNTPKQPLAFHPSLTAAAQFHSAWQIAADFFGHLGVGDSMPWDRMAIFGYAAPGTFAAGENIGWQGELPGTPDMTQYTIDLQRGYYRDDGLPEAGHRINMMQEGWMENGMGLWSGPFLNTDGVTYNAVMSTQTFASIPNADPFITGVAYVDLDSDNFYSPFEGLPEVIVITISGAGDVNFAVAYPSSGGYAIQVPAGTYIVAAMLYDGTLFSVQQNVIVNTENVKVDFQLPAPPALPSASGLNELSPKVQSAIITSTQKIQKSGFGNPVTSYSQ